MKRLPIGLIAQVVVVGMIVVLRRVITIYFGYSLLAVALIGLLGLTAAAAAPPQDNAAGPEAPLNERVLDIPGDNERPVTLQVTVFTPDGPGPFPLAVMNHGATNVSDKNRGTRYHNTYSAYYFLSRGYAVALPMMRGFAGSGGNIVHRGCDLAAVAISNARDIRAVIQYMATQPNIDAQRIVVAGQSFGGWNTLGFGTLDYPNVRGLINFSGGLRSSDCYDQDVSLIAAAATLGSRTKIPSLWLYGDNDKVFPIATWREMYERYTKAGGRAELVDYGRFMDDSHQLLSHAAGLAIWTLRVDRFLLGLGLPASPLHPEYLPAPIPPATHFAAIDDIAAVPYLSDRGRELYRLFLSKPFPRAFAVAPNGAADLSFGGYDPLRKAVVTCQRSNPACQLYAANDVVVWTKQATSARPTVSNYNIGVPAGVTTLLNFAYSVKSDCSLQGLPKISVTQAPSHGVARVGQHEDFPRFASDSPYAACNKMKVRGVAIDYTPADGFAGSDLLTFEETTVDNRDLVFKLTITVK